MESISEIRHRIRVVNQTRQITRAMHMISSAKIRRGLKQYHDNDTYDRRLRATVRNVLIHMGQREEVHPFLQQSENPRVAVLVIGGDKGLAGGYNHNVIRLARRHLQPYSQVKLFTVGHVASDYFTHHAADLAKDELDIQQYGHVAQDPRLYHARGIATELTDLFLDDTVGEVWTVYTRMISPAHQMAKVLRLLPLRMEDFEGDASDEEHDLIYQPSPRALLDTMVPQVIIGSVFSALIQSYTSEHAARLRAMENATRNADEYLEKLRLHMNRARQAAITQEIAEMMGGVDAMLT